MAIWNFRVNFVPSDCLIQMYGALPLIITEDEINQLKPWKDKYFDFHLLDDIAPEGDSWSEDIRVWGNDKTDSISVIYDEEEIIWVCAKMDLRGRYSQFASQIVEYAQKMDCILHLNNNKCFEAELSVLMSHIRNSLAYKFVQNPQKALEDLGRERKT